jgi:hypothetical protein
MTKEASNMAKLQLTPILWKNSGPIIHTEDNILRCEVEGVEGAYVDRAGAGWRYDIGVPVESEADAQFNSAQEAAAALEEWFARRASMPETFQPSCV